MPAAGEGAPKHIRQRWPRSRVLGAIAALFAISTGGSFPAVSLEAAGAETEARSMACAGGAGDRRSERHNVIAVVDAETLRLDDGSELRLIGALAPRNPAEDAPLQNGATTDERWPPEVAAREVLTSLALGRAVDLVGQGASRDRYGRRLAQAYIAPADGGERVWLQGALVAVGHARAYGIPGSYDCVAELIAAEKMAREKRVGLWSLAAYDPRPARRTRDLRALRETFQIVEGTVTHARRTKRGIFLDFGSDWRWDFSLAIAPSAERVDRRWASGLLDLAGKRVRARGWIVRRNGPAIEIDHPSQIELLD